MSAAFEQAGVRFEDATEAEAEAVQHLVVVYRALAGAKPSLTHAAILLDGMDVSGSIQIEDDFSDLLARVGQMVEACGGRVPA